MSKYDYVRRLKRDAAAFVAVLERDALVGQIIRGEADRSEYVRFLIGTYQYVRWSGVLLARTAEGLRRHGGSPALLALFAAKAEEEAPHDRWVLEDLRRCGVNVELVKGEAPPPAVLGYVHSHLALADSGSVAFLGAAYLLEFASAARAHVAAGNLRARALVPNIERALSFLEGHGDADRGHVALLEAHLAELEDVRGRGAIRGAAALLTALFPLFFGAPREAVDALAGVAA